MTLLEIGESDDAIYLPYLVLHHTAWSPQKGMSTFESVYDFSPCLGIISYALLESAIRPDMQPKSSRSHEAEPTVIWRTDFRITLEVRTRLVTKW